MNKRPPIEVKTGMLVFTSDGDEMGRVKRIDGSCFQIDVILHRDLWLDRGAVESTELGVVQLNIPKDAFNQQTSYDTGHTGIDTDHPGIHEGHHGIAGHSGVHLHA
jgi:hypothetical protein